MADKTFTPLSNTEIAAFCSQTAMILRSGISSIEGISIMLEDSQNADEKELLSAVNDTLMMAPPKTRLRFPNFLISGAIQMIPRIHGIFSHVCITPIISAFPSTYCAWNGYSHKTVTSSMGDIDLDIPRDRKVNLNHRL